MSIIASISGIEGCGKTTLLKAVYKRLNDNGYTSLCLSELRSTPVGLAVADIVRNTVLNATTEALLFQAARYEQYHTYIENSTYDFLLLDRYVDDTYVMQRVVGGCEYFAVNLSFNTGVDPDITFVLDVPDNEVEKVINRSQPDKFLEMDVDIHRRINMEYRKLNRPRHVHLAYNDPYLVDKVYGMIVEL